MTESDAVNVENGPDGWVVPLRVQPKARVERIIGVHAGALKVAVMAPPDKGKANAAVCQLLARVLAVPTSSCQVVSGHASRDKRVCVGGEWTEQSLRAALRTDDAS